MKRESNLVPWLVVTGVLAIWAGTSDILSRWRYLVFGARLCDVLILASGVLLLASGVWQIFFRTGRATAGWIAAGAATTFALTLFGGVWSGAIPCSGPG
jgi:hypothetical protein